MTNAGASGNVTFTEAALSAYFTDPDSATIGVNTVAAGSGVTSATGTSLGAANVGTVGTITITDNTTLSGCIHGNRHRWVGSEQCGNGDLHQ